MKIKQILIPLSFMGAVLFGSCGKEEVPCKVLNMVGTWGTYEASVVVQNGVRTETAIESFTTDLFSNGLMVEYNDTRRDTFHWALDTTLSQVRIIVDSISEVPINHFIQPYVDNTGYALWGIRDDYGYNKFVLEQRNDYINLSYIRERRYTRK